MTTVFSASTRATVRSGQRGEQVLSEQTLGQHPIIRQLMQCFKSVVHPHCRRNIAVVDAVGGQGIVGYALPGAASVPDVEVAECR